MSNGDSATNGGANGGDVSDMSEVRNDPVLQGHSALNDPNLSGSTASVWTGTGGPDPGGVAGPAELDDQGGASDTSADGSEASPS